jgi:hypothetical protein
MEKRESFGDEHLELIQLLQDGGMFENLHIRFCATRALQTGDYNQLLEFLDRYPAILRQAKNNIAIEEVQKRYNPFRPYPSRDDVRLYLNGPIRFGYVNEHDDMFGIGPNVLSLPTIIPGRVGGGKSTVIKNMQSQILKEEQDFNVIIPDLKIEYRDLLTISDQIKVLLRNHIIINPLEVPSWMTPQEHIVFFSKLFCSENWVGATSEDILNDEIEDLFTKRGVFDGSKNYPQMRDLYNQINYKLEKQRSFGYRDIFLRLRGRIKTYLSGDNFSCRKGIPHDFWRKENVVLEMDTGFTDKMYSFTISFIAGLNYTYNKKNRLMGSILRTLICVDEGRILFAIRDTETYGEAYISEIITKTREFGIGFVVASPETASFNQTIKAISYLKICFPLTDGQEKAAIKESFGLNDEQADYLFKMPRHGQAIVRYGSFDRPFLLDVVPLYRIEKNLTDDEVEERMSDFYHELESHIEKVETATIRTGSPTPQESNQDEIIPPAEATLLYYLSKEPFTNTSDLKNAPGFNSNDEVKRAINWLVDRGYVEQKKIKISSSGRYPVFSIITEKAFAKFPTLKRRPGKGSFEHGLYQHLIRTNLESQGMEAKVEGRMKDSTKSIDVLAKDKRRSWIAFEVVLSFKNLLRNIHEDFASGVAEVVIVTRDKEDTERVVKIVAKDQALNSQLGKITFSEISAFSC